MKTLDAKVAVVTGAGSGIGAAIAKRFAGEGASVALFDLNVERARSIAAQIGTLAPAIVIGGDASCEADVRRAIEQVVGRYSHIDVLVNNAGTEQSGSVVEMSVESWDRVISVNLRSMFLFAKYAIPHMRSGGAIINISSIDAFASYPGYAAYDASKAAVLALTRALAIDHGGQGIRANAICPGYIDTPLLAPYLERLGNPDQVRREIASLHPLGHIGRPEHIADAALFLASGAASFITGTQLVVDGGLTARGR